MTRITVGKGRVVLFSSTAATEWNNQPIHPNFVPFLQRIIGYFSPEKTGGSLPLVPDAVFQGEVPSDLVSREVSVLAPGSNGKPRPAGKIELVNQDAVLRYRDTAKTGAYRFTVPGEEKPISAFPVQMDTKESALRTIPADELTANGAEKSSAAPSSAPAAAAAPSRCAGNSGPSSSGGRAHRLPHGNGARAPTQLRQMISALLNCLFPSPSGGSTDAAMAYEGISWDCAFFLFLVLGGVIW